MVIQRRYLERQIDQPFDAAISMELDAAIAEQEPMTECERDDHAL